ETALKGVRGFPVFLLKKIAESEVGVSLGHARVSLNNPVVPLRLGVLPLPAVLQQRLQERVAAAPPAGKEQPAPPRRSASSSELQPQHELNFARAIAAVGTAHLRTNRAEGRVFKRIVGSPEYHAVKGIEETGWKDQ